MIQYFIEMPIEKQTWTVLSAGWLMLVASAVIREKVPPGECRNWARAMGVFAVGLVSLQTIHATFLVKELNTELMVRRGSRDAQQTEAMATQIADPVRVLAVASEYSAVNKAGAEISVTRLSSGQLGSVSLIRGRSGFDTGTNLRFTDRTRSTGFDMGGSDRRSGSLSSGTSGVNF